MLDELADPLGVLDVGLLAGDVAQVPRVQQPALDVVFEYVEVGSDQGAVSASAGPSP